MILKHHVHAEPRLVRQLVQLPDPQLATLDTRGTLEAVSPWSDSLHHPQPAPEIPRNVDEIVNEISSEAAPSSDSPEYPQATSQLSQSEMQNVPREAITQSSQPTAEVIGPAKSQSLQHQSHATLRITKQGSRSKPLQGDAWYVLSPNRSAEKIQPPSERSVVSAPGAPDVLDAPAEPYTGNSLKSTARTSGMGFRRLLLSGGSTREPLGSVFEVECQSAALYDKGSSAPIVSETPPPDAQSSTTASLPEWWTDEDADASLPLSAAQRTLGKKLSQYHRLERRRLKYLVKTGVLEFGATKVDLRLWQMQHRPQDLEGRARVPV